MVLGQADGEDSSVAAFATAQGAPGAPAVAPADRDASLAAGVHEVQNALTGVIGWLSICREASDATLRARALEMIEHGVQRARVLVADLADPNHRFSVRPRNLDLRQIVQSVRDFVAPRCEREAIALEVFSSSEVVTAFGDPDRIAQILTNLVINAVDAVLATRDFDSSRGRIVMEAEAGDTTAIVRVIDDGVGMDADTLARVFEPYFTTHPDGTDTRAAGTGLGLSICRTLALAMGGQLELTSRHGRGTTATLTLRREAHHVSLAPTLVESVSAVAGLRVLVVDDEPSIREMLEVAFTLRGATVATASTLREARHALAHDSFDVAVVDDTLNDGESGAAFVVDIERAMPSLAAVLMTGAPSIEHIPRDAAKWLLRKPFSLDDVVRIVGRAATARSSRRDSTP